MFLLFAPSVFAAAPLPVAEGAELAAWFEQAAEAEGVPPVLLLAVGYEASHLVPQTETSAWGGRTFFDFVEADEVGGPDLERASALIGADPNRVITDWRLATRAAAALLADSARAANGGMLPPADALDAWQPALRAFSGRHEVFLQDLYVEGVVALLQRGFSADGRLGAVTVAPQAVSACRPAAPPPGSTDYSGAAKYVQACDDNYTDDSRSGSDIDMVVIHTVQGSYSGCASWFQNCSAGASAHYVVRSEDGEVTQMVREADIGWHAGNWDVNVRSVGIEHEGYVSDCSYYTEELYAGSAALTLDIATRQGVPLDRSHIIGHDEVPDPDGSGYGGSGHHTDPGDCWDWDYFMGLLTGGSGGELIGYVRADDIYNAEGNLVGATAWIEETGETTVVDEAGLYRFEGVPAGNYTVRASFSGYAEGSCFAELTGTQEWCSIALSPLSDEPPAEDTGTDEEAPPTGRPPGAPGKATALPEVGAACNTTPAASSLWALALAALGSRRARRRSSR